MRREVANADRSVVDSPENSVSKRVQREHDIEEAWETGGVPSWAVFAVGSVGMILLGFGLWMIVGEYPREWEGPTLIYFNLDDGIATSDILAVIECLIGEMGILWAWYHRPRRRLQAGPSILPEPTAHRRRVRARDL